MYLGLLSQDPYKTQCERRERTRARAQHHLPYPIRQTLRLKHHKSLSARLVIDPFDVDPER